MIDVSVKMGDLIKYYDILKKHAQDVEKCSNAKFKFMFIRNIRTIGTHVSTIVQDIQQLYSDPDIMEYHEQLKTVVQNSTEDEREQKVKELNEKYKTVLSKISEIDKQVEEILNTQINITLHTISLNDLCDVPLLLMDVLHKLGVVE